MEPETGRSAVVCFGEAMLRLSTAPGVRLAQAASLEVHVAGAEANVAAGLAQLGVPTRWVSRLPDSDVGRRVERELAAAGVGTEAIEWAPGERLGLFFADTGAAPRPTAVVYDRSDSAFTAMTELPPDALAGAGFLHLTGITVAVGNRDLLERLLAQAKALGVKLSFDVNHRSLLWTPAEAREALRPLLRRAAVLVCSESDARLVLELEGDSEQLLDGMREHWAPDAEALVLTRGDRGCVALDQAGRRFEQRADPATVLERFGMGDAFVAGLLWGLRRGELPTALAAGVTLAALKATIAGDFPCITEAELEAALRRPAPSSVIR